MKPVAAGAPGSTLFPWSPIDPTGRIVVRTGSGSIAVDTDGREYVDASSLSLTCGYADPRVVEAVREQLEQLLSLIHI